MVTLQVGRPAFGENGGRVPALKHALGEMEDGLLEVPGVVAHPGETSELAGEDTGSLMRWGVGSGTGVAHYAKRPLKGLVENADAEARRCDAESRTEEGTGAVGKGGFLPLQTIEGRAWRKGVPREQVVYEAAGVRM